MEPHFEKLQQAQRIERLKGANRRFSSHAVRDRDLVVARSFEKSNRNWSLAIVYNAMLEACQAFMQAHGYQARGNYKDRTKIDFASAAFPEARKLFHELNQLRHRRRLAVFDGTQISASEIEGALALAGKLLPILKIGVSRQPAFAPIVP